MPLACGSLTHTDIHPCKKKKKTHAHIVTYTHMSHFNSSARLCSFACLHTRGPMYTSFHISAVNPIIYAAPYILNFLILLVLMHLSSPPKYHVISCLVLWSWVTLGMRGIGKFPSTSVLLSTTMFWCLIYRVNHFRDFIKYICLDVSERKVPSAFAPVLVFERDV